MKIKSINFISMWLFTIVSSYNCNAAEYSSETINADKRTISILEINKGVMHNLNRESEFENFINKEIEPFWETFAKPGRFINRQGLKIHFVEVGDDNAKHTIVISPGRVEGYLKYKEMAFDLVHFGFRVFIIDHQGQGLSSRLLVNTHKGHVKHFDDYTSDFNQFMTEIVEPKVIGSLSLLAHSMGSAIGLRYLQVHPHKVNKAVFSSPMWGLPTGPIPATVLKPVVKSAAWLVEQVQPQSPYFLGSMDYDASPFLTNTLTHSKARYKYFRQTYKQFPDLQLGGVTYSWVVASINGLEKAYQLLDRVNIPVMVLQAEKDIVVDNKAQDDFCARLKDVGNEVETGAPIVVKGANHEIFIEKDDIRTPALAKIVDFIKE